MFRVFVGWGSILSMLSVAIGAFGAHMLEPILTADRIDTYQTGVDYHMMHALGLICIGILSKWLNAPTLIKWAGSLMMIGILLFSGSLYVLSISGITVFGAITPLGGVAFIVAWLLVAVAVYKSKKE